MEPDPVKKASERQAPSESILEIESVFSDPNVQQLLRAELNLLLH